MPSSTPEPHSETFPLHNHLIEEQRPSKFVKGHKYTVSLGFICPACGQKHLVEQHKMHGTSYDCKCGLYIQVWGNSINLQGEPKL